MTDRHPDPQTSTPVCYRHADRATRLTCSRCGRPICAECSIDAAVGHRCPECVRTEGTTRVVRGRNILANPTFDTSPVSFSIIAFTVAIYLVGALIPQAGDELFRWLAFFTPLVEDGEWWRALTVTLLHAGLIHIGFNMYALYLFGPRLEQQVGSLPFAALWLASAAGGSAASFLLGDPTRPAVGASGAIFGLFGAWIYVSWVQRSTPAGRAQFRTLGILLGLNLVLSFGVRSIDQWAHLGGLAAGLLIAAVWRGLAVGKQRAEVRRTLIASIVLVACLGVVILL